MNLNSCPRCYILYLKLICICVGLSGFRNWAVVNLSCFLAFLSRMSFLFIQTLSFVHSFIYSFIMKTYIAPLQQITIHTENLHSTPSVDYYSFSHSGDLKYYIVPLIIQKLLSWNDSKIGRASCRER